MNLNLSPDLKDFARQHKLQELSGRSLQSLVNGDAEYTVAKARQFLSFQSRINAELLRHPVITDNKFTSWFSGGTQNVAQIKAFIVQFSVFSNLFLVAQLLKTINADTLEGMRASKEILANEIGVIFNSGGPSLAASSVDTGDTNIDPNLVATEGSIEGGRFRYQAAHFEWLLRIAEKLDLTFNDLGKRRHGIESTLFFCDELQRLYGSEDYTISQASSYAVENWAAAGFWDELICGFKKFKACSGRALPLAFFTWHSRIEAQHASHTQEEMEEIYFSRDLEEDQFIRYGNEMLDGVKVFWDGLDEQRRQLTH